MGMTAPGTGEMASAEDQALPNSNREDAGDRKIARLARIEWIVAILLSAVVLFLIVARTMYAGPLWRDECDSLQLARIPRFAELVQISQHSSFPLLFPVSVRTYTSLFGTSDISVRCFGLAVGICFLGVAWFQARSISREVPLLMLALIGLNVNFFTAGMWLRGYGLGSVLIILAFVLTAKFLVQPSASRLAIVFFAYLASMQCLFFNGALVPAIVLAAAVVFFVRGEWKWLSLLLGAAAVCGLSYLPYIWKVYFSTSAFAPVLQMPVPFSLMARRFLAACGGSNPIVILVWLGLVSLCVIGGLWRLKIAWNAKRTRQHDMLLFALLAIPLCVLAYYGFLLVLQNMPLQRYFLALISLIATAATLIAANISSDYRLRLARLALVVVVSLTTLLFAPWARLRERLSNIDIVAQRVEKDARPNDLIVVNPWSVGISFNRYYQGGNRWTTAPKINDHRVHRYDLLQAKMIEFFPLNDVEQDIEATLKSGNRVWIVGTIIMGSSNRSPVVLAPAPDPTFGWQSSVYVDAWSRELGEFMRRHAGRVDLVVRRGKLVSERENIWLLACEGWKY